MKQDSPKNWWQTAAGVMTGLAALLTAIAGLIVALAQTGFIGRDRNDKLADPSANIDRRSSEQLSASAASLRNVGRESIIAPIDEEQSAGPAATKSPRIPISLPEKREYVLGPETVKAHYILTDATVTRLSQESAKLSIKIHFIADGMRRTSSNISSSQFTLAIEDTEIDAQPRFSEQVRFGDSIDRYVNFTVPANTVAAVLRIKVGWDSHAEIPLKIATNERERRE